MRDDLADINVPPWLHDAAVTHQPVGTGRSASLRSYDMFVVEEMAKASHDNGSIDWPAVAVWGSVIVMWAAILAAVWVVTR